jgi:hypothetical protein
LFSESETILPRGVLGVVFLFDFAETLGLGVQELFALQALIIVQVLHDIIGLDAILLQLLHVTNGQSLQLIVESFFLTFLKL